MRILIVEDSRSVARALTRTLANRGHQPEVAPTFAAAVARLTTNGLDLVLLDLELPDSPKELTAVRMFDLLDQLRTFSPPVIGISGYPGAEKLFLDAAARASRTDSMFFKKPFADVAAFIEAIEAHDPVSQSQDLANAVERSAALAKTMPELCDRALRLLRAS